MAIASGRRKRRRRIPRPMPVMVPMMIERQFGATLRRLIFEKLTESIRKHLLPQLPALVAEARSLRPNVRRDAYPEEVAALMQAVNQDLSDVDIDVAREAEDIAATLNSSNRGQWARAMRQSIGVDIVAPEPWLRTQLAGFTRQNVTLIKKLREQSIDEIEGVVQRGLQAGARVEGIREDILDRVGVSRSRAQLIARDQVAKFSGQLNELRQTGIGVTQYRWRTARDERVRGRPGGRYPASDPSHWAMRGKLCIWSDPKVFIVDGERVARSSIKGVQLHPGQDFQCRCTAEPVLDDLLEGL